MKTIKGYVCVGRVALGEEPREEILFGPHVKNGGWFYESLRSNGLRVYEILDRALEGFYELLDSAEFDRVRVGELRMTIAEDDKEIKNILGYENFVVLSSEKHGLGGALSMSLLGPNSNGNNDERDLGMDLSRNGLEGFKDIGEAICLARRIRKSTDDPIWISTFELGFVDYSDLK